jgi:hypothetical protein
MLAVDAEDGDRFSDKIRNERKAAGCTRRLVEAA